MKSLFFSIFGILLVLPFAAFAAADPCLLIGSRCGPSLAGIYGTAGSMGLREWAAVIMVGVASGLSIIFIVVGALQMLIAFGDDAKVQRGKTSVLYALAGMFLVMVSQNIIGYVAGMASFHGVGSTTGFSVPQMTTGELITSVMKFAVDIMWNIFNSVFILVLIVAGFRMVFARGVADEFNKAKNMFLWALVAAVVINLATTLVNIVLNLF
ncbi:MAG: hypothetical protein V1926_03715 [Candidatus Peregrinibacteria bacterium]